MTISSETTAKSSCCAGPKTSSSCCGGGGGSPSTAAPTTDDTTTPNNNSNDSTRQDSVSTYYGATLTSTKDLKTSACCTKTAPPLYIRDALKQVADVVQSKYYGCGVCLPDYDLTGASILDLGCGAGRDVYLASQLVGASGKVVGVDMTPALLQVAREYQDYHANVFGYANTYFYPGKLETLLDDVPELQQESFDLIISNCVLNLCTDKAAVLQACYKLLRPGGEMYFSDVYTNQRVATALQQDDILWNECLSGALYWNDFETLAKQAGFIDPRLVEDRPIALENRQLEDKVKQLQDGLQFYSATYRLVKVEDSLEASCEDYGLAVRYNGSISRAKSVWKLDKHHVFSTGRVTPVSGNTFKMLQKHARFVKHFDFYGTWGRHYGVFQECCCGSGCGCREGKCIPFDTLKI